VRFTAFAGRNGKELLRDPMSLVLMVGLPLILLFVLSAMNNRVPADVFGIASLAPGIAVFGLAFIALFSGTLIANDRGSSFLARLHASPLSSFDFIMGYTLPLMYIAVAQSLFCFVAAFFLGLPVSMNVVLALLALLPVAVLFVGFGLLLGTLFSPEQVGGIGSILVVATTLLGGTWFDLSMIGGTFETVANALPFAHAVDATRAAINGDVSSMFPNLLWCIAYAAFVFLIAVFTFKQKMSR
jgi:ABC-2 type transport system permease protein